MMEDVLVKLNVGLLWLKLHSTRRQLFLLHIGLKTEEETNKMLHLEHSFIWCWHLDDSGSRSETPGKFEMWCWRRMEKISLTYHVRNEEVLLRVKEQRNILHEITKWVGHILHRNCLLQWVIEGKIKGGIEVTGRRGRRCKKLLDDLKERRGYSHLKEEALDHTRAHFARGFGPVARQTTKWMKFFPPHYGPEVDSASNRNEYQEYFLR